MYHMGGEIMQNATVETIEKILRIKKEKASEIMRSIGWDMVQEALHLADVEMGDVGVAYLKKDGVLPTLVTDESFFKQYTALYVDVASPNVPTLLYDVKMGEFYVTPLNAWLCARGHRIPKKG